MERLTISSSLKYKEQIRSTINKLTEIGITGIFPNLDLGVKKEDVDLEFMKLLEKQHFEAIDNSEGLYVICPDGYVGTLVSVEIGYARGQQKPVIFSEQPTDLGLQALVDAIVPLNQLSSLISLDSL